MLRRLMAGFETKLVLTTLFYMWLTSSPIQGQQLRFEEPVEVATYMNAQLSVLHLEHDEFVPGNLLFADSDALKTTDGTTTSVVVGNVSVKAYKEGVAGEAFFNSISSFVQLASDKVMAVDHANNCTRLIDRNSNGTTSFVGKCLSGGYLDGPNAKFAYPNDLIRYRNQTEIVLITDVKNNAIRVINTNTRITSTLMRDDIIRDIRSILQHGITDTFYITTKTAVFKYTIGDDKPSILAGAPEVFFLGSSDGAFDQALFDEPAGMYLLNEMTLLVADARNNKIRVLDLENSTTSSICSGNKGSADGPGADCTLYRPSAFYLLGDKLLIGQIYRIRQIKVVIDDQQNYPSYDAVVAGSSTLEDYTYQVTPASPTTTVEPFHQTLTGMGVIIGVSAVLLVIALAVVIAVCVKKKRTRSRQESGHKSRPLPSPNPPTMIYQYRKTASDDSGAYEEGPKAQYDLIDEDYYTDPDIYDTIQERKTSYKPKSVKREPQSVKRDPHYIDFLETRPVSDREEGSEPKDYGSRRSTQETPYCYASQEQDEQGKVVGTNSELKEEDYLQPVSSLPNNFS